MAAYYNEFDSYAAAWLRNLIAAGLIPPGDVDERSIADVRADDLAGYTQAHFFAGIGGWPYALRLAGWPVDRPVWTGSCPCQPFSAAGKRRGTADERHLWPEFRRLIAECRPEVVFGEQVASADGRAWLGGQPGLQRLQDREAVLRVLSERNLIGRLPDALQGLLSNRREREESEDAEGQAEQRLQEVASAEPGGSVGQVGGIPGEREGPALHDRPEGDSNPDRRGVVPVDRDRVQPRWRQNVGQPVPGSDRQLERIHAGEYEGRSLLPQRHGEHLGREQDYRDRGSDHGPASQSISRIAGSTGISVEAASRFQELSGVRADLEALGYGVGAADLCAAGVGAPHIRQRLWWVGHAEGDREGSVGGVQEGARAERGGGSSRLGDAPVSGIGAFDWQSRQGGEPQEPAGGSGLSGWMGDADSAVPEQPARDRPRPGEAPGGRPRGQSDGSSEAGFWSSAGWLPCTDGKARRTEPSLQPLAHGVPNRVGRLRAYGNAIVPQVAAEFVRAFREGVTDV